MTQPPPPGRDPVEGPARDSGLPGGATEGPGDGPRAAGGSRDPRLAGFAEGGPGDTCTPGPELAATLADLSGPQWRCQDATDEELIGLLGRWDAIESWAEAAKLGVVRELLRRRGRPGLLGAPSMHGDLPDRWEDGVEHEVSAALQVSLRSADNLTCFAWDLQARLPGIGAALAAGVPTPLKARIISDELKVLDDEHAVQAEKLILDQLDGQTPAQLGRLAAQMVVTVDPDGAARRREHAEREEARVRFWRDNGGACALAAFGLPTDAALAANDAINNRAEQYKAAKTRPGARMDQLRVLAFLDILNGIALETRIAQDRAAQAGEADGPGGTFPDDDGSATSGLVPSPIRPALTARANLTFPLATLQGLADRPGTGHGLGPLDPALVRDAAVAAANSPASEWCLTITDGEGVAVAHGCARPARTSKTSPPPASRDGPRAPTPWVLTPRDEPGSSGEYGTWDLTLPGGQQYTVKLQPIPVTDCDHRHESHGYQPNDTLRHLVQVRDGTCTFPPCNRHARESDFEHAVPYDQGVQRRCAKPSLPPR